ncbi:MAG: DUF805 domain-containing protein [Candidatus Baltobacteraceae bacterium]
MRYYIQGLRKYAVFQGRAGRPEFWYFYLYNFLAILVIGFLSGFIGAALGSPDTNLLMVPADLFILATALPSWGVLVRRCHDIGLNPWWSLLTIVPLLGLIALIGIGVRESQPDSGSREPVPDARAEFGR